MVTPYMNEDNKSINKTKLLKGFYNSLYILDNFGVKKVLGEIAKDVLLQGAYYGYKVNTAKGVVLQKLPINYCRSRYN